MKHVGKNAAYLVGLVILMFQLSFITPWHKGAAIAAGKKAMPIVSITDSSSSGLYDSMRLSASGLSKQAFNYAVQGYKYLLTAGKIKNDGVLSIIDFTLPSCAKRLFVIDLKSYALLFNTYVSHGRNSGKALANEFSNDLNSFKSSLGFYVTSGTYNGKHGYSLKLEGEEQGINDNALNRGIVMHCAPYVSESYIKSQGYIGRSEGCPAVSPKVYKPIIKKIKDGSCLFMYSPNEYYLSHSAILKSA
jgi:hypothetical protein